MYETIQTPRYFDNPTSLQSHSTPLNRLSEQEEEDDDGDYDDDDVEGGCEEDVMDNVSKKLISTSSNFACYSGLGQLGDSKHNAYSCATDVKTNYGSSLRKRNNTASANTKSTKSKCVHFMPTTKSNYKSPHRTLSSSAELNAHSKPLKKIVFNGTFPIDDPYSSRF